MSDDFNQLTPKPMPKNRFITGANINAYKQSLIAQYRSNGHKSVLQKIKKSDENTTSDQILGLIIEQILQGGQDLLGTQLLLAQQGNLQMSTATVVKRSQILKAVADVVAKRKELNQRASDIDLNSPAFMIFQKLMFDKMISSLEQLSIDEQMISLIVQKWSQKMQNWGKELKQKLQQMAE